MTFPVLGGGSGAAAAYTLTNSLRFRRSAYAYLNRTFTTPTNAQKWTWSGWVKRGSLDNTIYQAFFGAGTAGNSGIAFTSSGNFYIFSTNGLYIMSNSVYNDPAAWYHIVVATDTTQATASNRTQIWINNQLLTSFSSANYIAQNGTCEFDSAISHYVGSAGPGAGAGWAFDGYQTQVNFIDGQALTPTSFGQFDSVTGVWQPKQYTGTYGNNGFYLPFTDTTSPTTLAYDQSGNGNNWTPNNISTTAGSTYDAMTDVPTLTSATQANYAVWNPLTPAFSDTFAQSITNGNLTITGNNGYALSTIGMSSGKYYFEFNTNGTNSIAPGIYQYPLNFTAYGFQQTFYRYQSDTGQVRLNTTVLQTYNSYGSGDVIGIAYDADNGKLYFAKNGVWQGGSDPAAGTNPAVSGLTGTWFWGTMASGGFTNNSNFGQQPWTYTPPTGFVALNTYNLPTPTIANGANVMAATLYTGNGTSQTINNSANNTVGKTFYPDLLWVKDRVSTAYNALFDSVRGNTKGFSSNTTAAESTSAAGQDITSFNSNGFSVGIPTQWGSTNNSGDAIVAWQWNAGSGVTSTNTNGSITSTVSVNPTAGFSIVTYTGTGANATVGHGLGVAPKMIIVKNRSGVFDWRVYVESIGAGNILLLNTTAASTASAASWNSTAPTSTVFSLGTAPGINTNTNNFVAYCWAAIPGYSAFGSYTGNGSTNGPFIYTGFRPRYILQKRTDSTGDWRIMDTSRATYNVVGPELQANYNGAEYTGNNFNILSNGFQLVSTGAPVNASGGTYIYAAFAENPFKYANAR